MIEVFILLLVSNIIILIVSVLRANFVDSMNLSVGNLLDPMFWLKNPPLFLILCLYVVWFFTTMMASRSASVVSETKLTASIYTILSLGIASAFTLIHLVAYQALRKETITPAMWTWASVAALSIIISCVALYMFLAEGQKVVPS